MHSIPMVIPEMVRSVTHTAFLVSAFRTVYVNYPERLPWENEQTAVRRLTKSAMRHVAEIERNQKANGIVENIPYLAVVWPILTEMLWII